MGMETNPGTNSGAENPTSRAIRENGILALIGWVIEKFQEYNPSLVG